MFSTLILHATVAFQQCQIFFGPGGSRKGPVKLGSVRPFVHPSIFPSFCLGVFLGLYHYFFSRFWHCARNPCEVVPDSQIFHKKFFVPKNGPKMGQKQGFLNYLKNLVINFPFICSVIKIVFIVFGVLHKSHIWENFCSQDMG